MRDVEAISSHIVGMRFTSDEQLRGYLEESGLEYVLEEQNDPILIVKPSHCKVGEVGSFRFSYLRLEGIKGAKLYRYRIYQVGRQALCIETDFAFKNPYER